MAENLERAINRLALQVEELVGRVDELTRLIKPGGPATQESTPPAAPPSASEGAPAAPAEPKPPKAPKKPKAPKGAS